MYIHLILIHSHACYLKCYLVFSLHSDRVVGTHDAPIRCVEYSPEANIIVTGSWDSTVKMWDPRSPSLVGTFPQPDKVDGSLYMIAYLFSYVVFSCTL